MSDTKKLNKEHLDEINNLRNKFTTLTLNLGELARKRSYLKQELGETEIQHDSIIKEIEYAEKMSKDLNEKLRTFYGDGVIDLEEGTFSPSETSN